MRDREEQTSRLEAVGWEADQRAGPRRRKTRRVEQVGGGSCGAG